MKASEFCNREVVVVTKDELVTEAAKLMRSHHVGSVVVVDSHDEPRRPIGIFTDRDIVVEFVSQDLSPAEVTVGDAVRYDLISVTESTELSETIDVMRRHAVRRVPVVDAKGGLVGLVASDDALELLAEQLMELVAIVSKQRRREMSHST